MEKEPAATSTATKVPFGADTGVPFGTGIWVPFGTATWVPFGTAALTMMQLTWVWPRSLLQPIISIVQTIS